MLYGFIGIHPSIHPSIHNFSIILFNFVLFYLMTDLIVTVYPK